MGVLKRCCMFVDNHLLGIAIALYAIMPLSLLWAPVLAIVTVLALLLLVMLWVGAKISDE